MPGTARPSLDRIAETEFLVGIGVEPGLAAETTSLLDTRHELAAQLADETGLERRDKEPFVTGVTELMDPSLAPDPQTAEYAERALAVYRMAEVLGLTVVPREVA